MRLIAFFAFAFSAGIFLVSCKDTSTNAGIPGSMVGYVVPYDSTNTNIDNSGVKVSVDGTNYSTLSDNKGRWKLDNVVPGTYNISFTKDGYATEKIIAYRFVGNGTDYLFSQNIYQRSRMNASLVTRPFDSATTLFTCKIFRNDTSESLQGLTLLLFGKDSALLPLDPSSYLYSLDNYGVTFDNGRGYDILIHRSSLITFGFNSGDRVYCVAYASNINVWHWDSEKQQAILVPSYLDIATGKTVYTAFGNNHSEVRSFILP